ncbi:MAG: ABC transporter ATP-binding protein [Acidobacteria bacterium]|nr:ABC transporter ATP-binding protein [Acidobacteriota bacterium]MCH8992590.1 ABC transporter ATP-binding protein [Acidobacteriota bacterium]
MSVPVALDDVSVQLGGTTILDHLSLEIAAGTWVSMIGPNGAGKTTVLRCITGAVPYQGTVQIGSSVVAEMQVREVARTVAIVPQHPTLPEGMRVVDYVLLGRTPHRGAMTSESEHDLLLVGQVLDALDLERFADRDVATLSGGELQRVVIARALAQDTPILLLDEPTTGLDIGAQQEVMELIDRLRSQRELTVLSAMHDLNIAGQFTERIVLVSGGRVVADGAPGDVLTPELIDRHYGARVRVEQDAGRVVVVPIRARLEVDESLNDSADGEADDPADKPDEEILDA